MFKIGLSGNRFSGKNEVCKIFEEMSIPVFDADLVVRFILLYEWNILAKVRDSIGSEYFKSGRLDAEKVAKGGVFGSILSIIEPTIFSKYYDFEKLNKGCIYTIFSSSILFDRRWYKKMDYNISVYAPKKNRLERAKNIEKSSDIIKINSFLNKEKDELVKNSLAKFVIHNYNEFDVKKQVLKIDQKLIDNYIKKEHENKIKEIDYDSYL
jgi:dephospho-CoA kinase